MKTPLIFPVRIVAKAVSLSPETESLIQAESQSLAEFHSRILSCDVHVEGPGGHHRRGEYRVRMVVGIPGRDIVISRRKSDSLHDGVLAAFKSAGRRLEARSKRVSEKRPAARGGLP